MMNCALLRPILKLLNKETKPNISHPHVFGRMWFFLNNEKDNLGQFDAKVDKGLLLEYYTSSKAFRICNKQIVTIDKLIHVTFYEIIPKLIEIEVLDCASILEKTLVEYRDQDKNQDHDQDKNQEKDQHKNRDKDQSK